MASQPGPLYAFPWESFGAAKYLVLAPFVVQLACSSDDVDGWAWHMLMLCVLRYAHAQAWSTLARLHAVSAGTRINGKPVEFKQVDRERNWDDYILLQALVMTVVHNMPGLGFSGFPAWSGRGLVQLALWHAGPTEFLYYWLHRALHWHPLYQRYHSHHHASFVAEPITGAPPGARPKTLPAREPGPGSSCTTPHLLRRACACHAAPPDEPPGCADKGAWRRRTAPPRRRRARAAPRSAAAVARHACSLPAALPPHADRAPCAGSVHPFAEHLMYTANFAVPLLGTWACGGASMAMFYVYLLGFDLLNAIGHCNFEFVPLSLFKVRAGRCRG